MNPGGCDDGTVGGIAQPVAQSRELGGDRNIDGHNLECGGGAEGGKNIRSRDWQPLAAFAG